MIDTERAFARTMAMRDHVVFTGFLAEEAVFFSGRVLRGAGGGRGVEEVL